LSPRIKESRCWLLQSGNGLAMPSIDPLRGARLDNSGHLPSVSQSGQKSDDQGCPKTNFCWLQAGLLPRTPSIGVAAQGSNQHKKET